MAEAQLATPIQKVVDVRKLASFARKVALLGQINNESVDRYETNLYRSGVYDRFYANFVAKNVRGLDFELDRTYETSFGLNDNMAIYPSGMRGERMSILLASAHGLPSFGVEWRFFRRRQIPFNDKIQIDKYSPGRYESNIHDVLLEKRSVLREMRSRRIA